KFDLKIDASVYDNGGSGFGDTTTGTNFQKVSTGSHSVSEAGHGTVNLADYDSAVSCDSAKGSSTTSSHSFSVAYGDKVTCTITNQRKPEIRVLKDVVPNSDPGKFDLKIDASVYDNGGSGFGDTTTGTNFQKVSTGSHSVSEAGHGTVNLADYDSAVSCDSAKGSSTTSSH